MVRFPDKTVMISLVVTMLSLCAFFATWRLLDRAEYLNLSARTELVAQNVRNEITARMEARLRVLEQLAHKWTPRHSPTQEEFELDAASVSGPLTGFQNIQWVDSQGYVRWLSELKGNEKALNLNVNFEAERRRVVALAKRTRAPQATVPIDLVTGKRGFLIFVPVYVKGVHQGYVLGVFRLKELFESILPQKLSPNYSVVVSYRDEPFFENDVSAEKKPVMNTHVEIAGVHWDIQVRPSTGQIVGSTYLPILVLLVGILLSGLLGATTYLLQRTRRSEEKLREANDNLEATVRQRTQSLEEYSQELLKSNAELERFAYVTSHDLKEPLRMVTLYTQLLKRRYEQNMDGEVESWIKFITEGTVRMRELIDGLLQYSRIGRGEDKLTPTDTGEVVGKVLNDLNVAITGRGAKVSTSNLPTVLGDRIEISQLFQNLISNAIKFNEDKNPTVDITAEKKSNEWVFAVKDNGIGIDKKYHEKVFDMFQRINRRDMYPGTGIGLAICKRIIDRYGGRIWLDSRLGQGTTFFFSIPAS